MRDLPTPQELHQRAFDALDHNIGNCWIDDDAESSETYSDVIEKLDNSAYHLQCAVNHIRALKRSAIAANGGKW